MSDWTSGAPGSDAEEVTDAIHGVTNDPTHGRVPGAGTAAGEGTGASQGAGQGEGADTGQGPGGAIPKDIFSRLADAGEEVIQRLAGMPGATRALDQAQGVMARLDELQKRVLGVEALERRVAELEARVAELESRDPGRRVDAVGFEG